MKKYLVSYLWTRGNNNPVKVNAEDYIEADTPEEAISYYMQYICDEIDKFECKVEMTDDEIICTPIDEDDEPQYYFDFVAE